MTVVLVDKAPGMPKGALNVVERRSRADNLFDVARVVLNRDQEVLVDVEPRAVLDKVVVLVAGGFVVLKSFFHTIIISEFPSRISNLEQCRQYEDSFDDRSLSAHQQHTRHRSHKPRRSRSNDRD